MYATPHTLNPVIHCNTVHTTLHYIGSVSTPAAAALPESQKVFKMFTAGKIYKDLLQTNLP